RGDEGHGREAMRPAQREPLGDDRRAAVGRDRQRGAERLAPRVTVDRLDTENASAGDDEVGDARLLAELDGQRADAVDQDRVEGLARDRHRVLAIGAPGADRAVRADQRSPVGRGDAHALQHAGDGVHGLARAEPIEQPRCLRAQILAADLRPREARAIEQTHAEPVLGQEDGGRRPRGPGADHDDVGRHDSTASRRPSTGYSRIVNRRAPAFSANAVSSSREQDRRTESGPSWREIGWHPSRRVASQTRPSESRRRRRSFTTTAIRAAAVISRNPAAACTGSRWCSVSALVTMSAARLRQGSAAASPPTSTISRYAATAAPASRTAVRSRSTTPTRPARPPRRAHPATPTPNAPPPPPTSTTRSGRSRGTSVARARIARSDSA